MQNRRGAGQHGDFAFLSREAGFRDGDCVLTDSDGVELGVAIGIAFGSQGEFGIDVGFQRDVGFGNGPMRRIMDDSSDGADCRTENGSWKKKQEQS
jgi:hypothetical protein